MAQAQGIWIHQYLDDWLVRAPCQETCRLHTQTLLALCRELGWVVNMNKSELTPQQVFNFVGYQFDLLSGGVLPTQDRWTTLQQKLHSIKSQKTCSVRLGRTLSGSTARGIWSEPESCLHINFLELKAVLLALKSFEHRCRDQIVLIAMDNTTLVSYINKEGGMRSGTLCALLWRLLSWCHPRKIVLRARHIPGRLNVIADKLPRHNQVIQTEWSLSQQVFISCVQNGAVLR